MRNMQIWKKSPNPEDLRILALLVRLFADDTSCLAEHSNLNSLILHVNNELQKLAAWFKVNKMAVNVKKTNYIIFHTPSKKREANCPDVVFNSNDINSPSPDPNLIHKLECIHDLNPDNKMRTLHYSVYSLTNILPLTNTCPTSAPSFLAKISVLKSG